MTKKITTEYCYKRAAKALKDGQTDEAYAWRQLGDSISHNEVSKHREGLR